LTTADFRALFEFDEWANRRVFQSLAGLSQTQWTAERVSSFSSLQATTAHVVVGEWIWLQRWQGTSPAAPPAWLRGPSVASLRRELEAIEAGRRDWLASLRDADLETDCVYRLLGGSEDRRTRLRVLLQHLVNHSSYHRGQIATLLRQVGAVPLATDLLVWEWERDG
jgi:uncharacterized damage-inducible protein DinB